MNKFLVTSYKGEEVKAFHTRSDKTGRWLFIYKNKIGHAFPVFSEYMAASVAYFEITNNSEWKMGDVVPKDLLAKVDEIMAKKMILTDKEKEEKPVERKKFLGII